MGLGWPGLGVSRAGRQGGRRARDETGDSGGYTLAQNLLDCSASPSDLVTLVAHQREGEMHSSRELWVMALCRSLTPPGAVRGLWAGHHHQAHAAHGPAYGWGPCRQRPLQCGQVPAEDRAHPGQQVRPGPPSHTSGLVLGILIPDVED